MNIAKTALKSGVLASVIFNILIFSQEAYTNKTIFIAFISTPILIVVSFIGIIATTFPIQFIRSKEKNNKIIFKMHFPYFSMVAFIMCAYFIYITEFEDFGYLASLTAFFTAMMSWIWLFSNEK